MKSLNITIYILISLLLLGCEQSAGMRTYKEIVIESPLLEKEVESDPHAGLVTPFANLPSMQQSDDPQVQKILQDSIAQVNLQWDTPSGWLWTKGSGMRVATFSTEGEQESITCTIVALSGSSGGLEANVERWLRQINIKIDQEQLNQFLVEQEQLITSGGINVQMVDISQLYSSNNNDQLSMVAAIAQVEGKTVYIKMTGTQSSVLYNKTKFKKLISSLRLNNE